MYNTFVKPIDAILNRFTMYRVVLYGLIGVLIIAVVLAAVGVLGVSALGLYYHPDWWLLCSKQGSVLDFSCSYE